MDMQIAKLASRGLVQHDTNSGAQYDVEKNQIVKLGNRNPPPYLVPQP
jgi:hypothetical protein